MPGNGKLPRHLCKLEPACFLKHWPIVVEEQVVNSSRWLKSLMTILDANMSCLHFPHYEYSIDLRRRNLTCIYLTTFNRYMHDLCCVLPFIQLLTVGDLYLAQMAVNRSVALRKNDIPCTPPPDRHLLMRRLGANPGFRSKHAPFQTSFHTPHAP
jgi:hypothetical protein